MSESNIVRAHVWVKGRVQGVGFRAHVEYCARQIGGLTGWVRNIGYDTVEAVAEGERGKVEQLIEMVKEGPRAARVDDSKIDWEEPNGEFDRFGVKRSL
jgi:acylphosphatase